MQANKTMSQAVTQLNQWDLPVNPINYAVSYEYCKNNNPLLIANIKHLRLSGKVLDNFFMEQLYKDYFLEQSKFRNEIVSDLSHLFSQINSSYEQSISGSQSFIDQLDDCIPALMSNNKNGVRLAIAKLHQASMAFKSQQQRLVEQVEISKLKTQELEAELEEVRKEIYLDPVTGLYNTKAMVEHVDTWLSEDGNKSIAAIVISVDHFKIFNERFGPLIGDVILSKMAKKIASYVDVSGLPVRSASDEFIVLMPDIDAGIASEIAEKIKQGVDKLRFVSVQSGIRLPKMSISCGISEMRHQESLNHFISRSRKSILPQFNC
ncbi:GGDEF domain-containing protein [Colwellia sp. 1_MG-2023]|jgi:diguanylate cyclase|uniref:GGDEF domain-containing protein n=1 Tax=unclassified Colwellia TaxID=196834 RepID=UPI001C0A4236|nr:MULTISPECIES: GGDEF domain-containing protein [unclassified Colwellia]MBU2923779.1 GGDEF domain-containing protein [Colwellia sp. C2M11]MDO6486365.1 GGDEF domain-containing protein [Colwellia sp. 6_MG-2023]MDO6654032.1 GGDEF domain-containing protein [Colwellia sp. 3_MG-2023]MDO6667001.1 GGDEF domain-containing protein [Colwellia sp. 2_MG-2023]MDO6691406.1 GGDEF domain-containing protein [Colwellia sp. 1_MG-2023]